MAHPDHREPGSQAVLAREEAKATPKIDHRMDLSMEVDDTEGDRRTLRKQRYGDHGQRSVNCGDRVSIALPLEVESDQLEPRTFWARAHSVIRHRETLRLLFRLHSSASYLFSRFTSHVSCPPAFCLSRFTLHVSRPSAPLFFCFLPSALCFLPSAPVPPIPLAPLHPFTFPGLTFHASRRTRSAYTTRRIAGSRSVPRVALETTSSAPALRTISQ